MKTANTKETSVTDIVERFKQAGDNIHRKAGAKRMATCYVQRKVAGGQEHNRVVAAIRRALTQAGLEGSY